MSGEAAIQPDRYRVSKGEPGANVVTLLKDGYPVMENPPMVPAILSEGTKPTIPKSVPAPIEQAERIALSLDDEKANYRYALVNLLNQEEAKKNRPKGEIKNNLLELYNSGLLLPNVYKKLGPISLATLYRYQRAFNNGGIEGLTPQKGQKGISKITDHEMNYLLTIYLRPNRIKKSYAITLTKEILKLRELESPSGERTLRRFLDEFEKEHYDLSVLSREGEKALKDKCLPYLERDYRDLEVGDVLVGDGHRLNFQIINPYTGKRCRAMLVLFWDWKSAYPLGWEVAPEESIQCIASALRNAIITLGKIPKVVYLDNGRAFHSKFFTEGIRFEDTELPGMFGRLGIKEHFAQAYNPQSKPIERLFKDLNEELERLIDSYMGSSIEDKPAWNKRNEKLARSIQNPWIPDIEDTNGLLSWWRNRKVERPHRGRDGQRPRDIFEAGKGPGVNPLELYYLMMEQKIATIHRNGITWLGWHWYNEALYGLKDEVIIKYSLSDLSQILVFYKNEFLCVAEPVEKVNPMASESENPKDMEAVKEGQRLKNRTKSTTRRLLDLVKTGTASQIDWSRTKTDQVDEIIQTIEEKQRPEMVPISPFPDDGAGTVSMPLEESEERPKYKPPREWEGWYEHYERYDYHLKQDPATLTGKDLEFIEWYKCTPEYRDIYEAKPSRILLGG
ncbi:MAG: Mu transposase C-terminal domain-containing protein [Thermodesulfobacteriota bacterium]